MTGGPVHGKPTTYSNHRCRCRPCTDAWAARVRDQRARRARTAREQPDTVPHGLNGYSNYGCRCDVCRAARTDAARVQRETKPGAAHPS